MTLNFIPQKANLPVAFKSGYSSVAPTCFLGENPRRLDMARDLDAAVWRREFIRLVGGDFRAAEDIAPGFETIKGRAAAL